LSQLLAVENREKNAARDAKEVAKDDGAASRYIQKFLDAWQGVSSLWA